MRGDIWDQNKRITPIYMGNTKTANGNDQDFRDHPHIYGEYYFDSVSMAAKKGSPPYIWGIPYFNRYF